MVEKVPPKISMRKPKKIKSTQQAVEDAIQAKEKWFAEKWEEQEKTWEKQWSEAKFDHKNICNILKSLYERQIQELEMAAQESKTRGAPFKNVRSLQRTACNFWCSL